MLRHCWTNYTPFRFIQKIQVDFVDLQLPSKLSGALGLGGRRNFSERDLWISIWYYKKGLQEKTTFNKEEQNLRILMLDDLWAGLVITNLTSGNSIKEPTISPPFIKRGSSEESI